MEQVTLSTKEFKALSSDNRTKILKLLAQQNHTLSELSKKLSLSSPSAKQHLEILEGAELVQQIDEGRKWKYYSLTKKGKKILDTKENQTQIFILLSVAAVLAIGGFLALQLMPPLGIANSETTQPLLSAPSATSGAADKANISSGYTVDLKAPENLYTQSNAIDCGKMTDYSELELKRIADCMAEGIGSCTRKKAFSSISTIEGDRIITFVEVAGKENEKCKIFVNKTSNDRFGLPGSFELNCFELNQSDPFASCAN